MLHLDVGNASEPYDLFAFAINADQTWEKYIARFKKFFEIPIPFHVSVRFTQIYNVWFVPDISAVLALIWLSIYSR